MNVIKPLRGGVEYRTARQSMSKDNNLRRSRIGLSSEERPTAKKDYVTPWHEIERSTWKEFNNLGPDSDANITEQ